MQTPNRIHETHSAPPEFPGIAVLAMLGMALVLAIALLGAEISRFDVLASL